MTCGEIWYLETPMSIYDADSHATQVHFPLREYVQKSVLLDLYNPTIVNFLRFR